MWEDDIFDKKDPKETVKVSKNILDKIKETSDNTEPIDDRTLEQLIDDDFIELDNRTNQQLVDDKFIELELLPSEEEVTLEDNNSNDEDDDNKLEEIEATRAHVQWDPKNMAVSADEKPRIKLSIDFNQKFKAANKIKK